MSKEKIAIFGFGGMAKDTADVCEDIGFDKIVLISEESENSYEYNSVSEDNIENLVKRGFKFVIGVANPKIRQKIYKRHVNLEYTSVIHDSATILGTSKQELVESSGLIIFPGVRIAGRVELGKHCIFNFNCTVGHDCKVGNFVSIMPGATVSGNVRLDSMVTVGSNASVLQGSSNSEKLKVGKGATIGMGAAAMRNVQARQTVIGVPASEIEV